MEELHKIPEPGREAGFDERGRRAGQHEHVDRRAQRRAQRHVVPSDADDEEVILGDVFADENVLRGEGGYERGVGVMWNVGGESSGSFLRIEWAQTVATVSQY